MNPIQHLLISASVVLALSLPLNAALTAPVRVDSGLVQGFAVPDSTITVFKGIPFAAPPVGDLRWRAPKAAAPWQGIRKADQFSAACMQQPTRSLGPWTEEYMHQGDFSEDCLYLNIWTPARAANQKLPVFVWIYGGAFTGGSTAVALYDGEGLARKGIVVVTVNYRVGPFGFLAHPELTKESDVKSSGNYGLLDQVAALQWVQKNIAAFGGDPKHVTIGGQSAGAAAVHFLTASPLARGLFQQAIAQSGSRLGSRSRKLAEVEAEGVKFAEAKRATSIAALRALPASKIIDRNDGVQFRPSIVVDGWFLPEDVSTIFAKGKQNDVATLTGWTADEGSSGPTYGKMSPDEFRKESSRVFGDASSEFMKLYPASTQAEASESQKAAARDQALVSTFLWATERAKTARTPVYTYFWTHVQPGPNREIYQSFHSSELPYMFNSLKRANRPWEAIDHTIAGTMSSYWANFIATGNPNGKGLPAWPAFDPKRPVTMSLGDTWGVRPLMDSAKLQLIEAHVLKTQQPR